MKLDFLDLLQRLAMAMSVLSFSCQSAEPRQAQGPDVSRNLVGPFAYENLTLYLVRGQDTDSRDYMTLDEGLTTGNVKLREVASGAEVDTLEIENASGRWLFLHAGDVVQGGQQDRTLATDALIPPHSKPQAIEAFCVEQGRWSERGDGQGGRFQKNTGIVAGRELKLSIQMDRDQSKVWSQVARYEAEGAMRVGGAEPGQVNAHLSHTGTYNAIVDNEQLSDSRRAYVKALLPQLEKEKGIVGVVAAVNGEITAADVYASSSLFRKLAPKLIDSYALEAFLSRAPEKAKPSPNTEVAAKFLAEGKKADAKENTRAQSMYRVTREAGDTVVFEYGEVGANGSSAAAPSSPPVHRSYVKKQDGSR